MSSTDPRKVEKALQELYDTCKTCEENFYAANEQMQNRGQKILLRRFAQQHKRFADQLEGLAKQMEMTLSPPGRYSDFLARGWMDIRIAMIVGRANRQAAAAKRSDADERVLLDQYEQSLQLSLPAPIRAVLEEQQTKAREIHDWLRHIATQEQWIIRLYDDQSEAKAVLDQLKAASFPADQVNVTPLQQITDYEEEKQERVHSAVDATLVGALIGGVVGLICGLAINYAGQIWSPTGVNFPEILWGSLLLSGGIGLLVGGSFGSFFGFLLARALLEEDRSLLQNVPSANAVVVSVHTTDSDHEKAANILQVRHQRELENATT